MSDPTANGPARDDDLIAALYEEINRLPEECRTAVFYDQVEAMTPAQAARRLGWTEAIVRCLVTLPEGSCERAWRGTGSR